MRKTHQPNIKQESWAIAKMTARCALHMVPWIFSRVP